MSDIPITPAYSLKQTSGADGITYGGHLTARDEVRPARDIIDLYPPKIIPLSSGKSTIVDEADYDWLIQWHWHFNGKYAARNQYVDIVNGLRKYKGVLMARAIMGEPACLVDHSNGNKLDNRRANLRLASISQNQFNKTKSLNKKSSAFKGVSLFRRLNKWRAAIRAQGQLIHLGLFNNETEAALAYNKAALHYFGEYALLNTTGHSPP